jgi:hypothetical protein
MNPREPPHQTPNSCFGAFRTISLLHDVRCKTCRTRAINAQVRGTNSRWNFSQRSLPIHPIGPQTHVLGRFGSFRYSTNVRAKEAEQLPLMHKFVEESCVRIFRNERTRTSLIGPQTQVLGCFGLFCYYTNSVQMGRTGPINAQVCETKSHQNFSQRTHPIHPIRPQTHVLRRFGPFHYCTNFGAKHAKLVPLMHKFMERSRNEIFRNERTRSTLLDPKLIFWDVLDHFITAQTLVQNRSNWGN